MPIECVQMYNGQKFTKRFSSHGGSDKPTIFQLKLREHEIRHKLILFILLMISVSSLNSIIAGATITSHAPLGWCHKQVLIVYLGAVKQMFYKTTFL